VSLATDEACGLIALLRVSNAKSLSIPIMQSFA
jgi:hypothetical protein